MSSLRASEQRSPAIDKAPRSRLPNKDTVEGRLYALNARTGTYTIEDGTGHSIRCHVDPGSKLAGRLDRLVQRLLRIYGAARRDASGRIVDIDVEHVEIPEETADETFWHFDLEAALEATEPIQTIDALAIPELSAEEGAAFRRALGFA